LRLADVLAFPLIQYGSRSAHGLWGYVIFIANGFLWAIVLLGIWEVVQKLRRNRRIIPREHC
jgi:hypothetical protein